MTTKVKGGGIVAQAGRPLTESGIFKKELIDFIEEKAKVKLDMKPNFWIETTTIMPKAVPSIEDRRTFIIHCGGGIDMVNTILSALESEKKYLSRITFFNDKVIKVSEKEQSGDSFLENRSVKVFFEKIKSEFSKYSDLFSAEIKTSVIVASKNDPVVIKILFSSEMQAELFTEHSSGVMKTQKDGKIVKITAKNSEIEILNSTKDILFIPKKLLIPEEKREEGENKTFASEKIVTKRGLLVTEADSENKASTSYVHMSTDYSEFHFLPFNRITTKRHVMELVDSMDKHGVISFVTIVVTDCIDGEFKKWVVDGQNRFEAMKYRGSPVLYTMTQASSKTEIVRLIADLNKTSRRWVTKNFLNAWHSLEIEDYTLLKKALEKTKFPITLLFEIFTGLSRTSAAKAFQSGKFEIRDKERSSRYIEYLVDIRRYIPRDRAISSAFLTFFRNQGEKYDHEKMIKNLSFIYKVDESIFIPGDPGEKILEKISKIYFN